MREREKNQKTRFSGLSRFITLENILFHSSLTPENESPLKIWFKKMNLRFIFSFSCCITKRNKSSKCENTASVFSAPTIFDPVCCM